MVGLGLFLVWGFTGPSVNPSQGSGLISAYNFNIGISASTPGYKLTVAGSISVAFNQVVNVGMPTTSTSATNKGYVDTTATAPDYCQTTATYIGVAADTACASGYHM